MIRFNNLPSQFPNNTIFHQKRLSKIKKNANLIIIFKSSTTRICKDLTFNSIEKSQQNSINIKFFPKRKKFAYQIQNNTTQNFIEPEPLKKVSVYVYYYTHISKAVCFSISQQVYDLLSIFIIEIIKNK